MQEGAKMQKVLLGNTGIEVSRLCFGTLTVGPLQANLPIEEGAEIMRLAIEWGINFFDTAQLYGTYAYIKRAMQHSGNKEIVISTKCYAYTRELAVQALEQARKELDRDVIDIFMLHEQESVHTLRGHLEALEYFMECKQKGLIKAVGASMHHVAAVEGAIEFGLDVIHPILNLNGLGIVDGDRYQMEVAVKKAHDNGIGVFSMKPLGGGNLFKKAQECLDYAFGNHFVDSVAIGMQSTEELKANINYLETRRFSPQALDRLQNKTRLLHIDAWCEGCSNCKKKCPQNAISIKNHKAVCDHSVCILCGYCAASCPVFAIKVV